MHSNRLASIDRNLCVNNNRFVNVGPNHKYVHLYAQPCICLTVVVRVFQDKNFSKLIITKGRPWPIAFYQVQYGIFNLPTHFHFNSWKRANFPIFKNFNHILNQTQKKRTFWSPLHIKQHQKFLLKKLSFATGKNLYKTLNF